MPTGTLTLPRQMIDAAISYAARESVSLPEFFELMLTRQYGYKMSVVVEKREPRATGVAISPRVRALRGIARIDGDRPYRDYVAEAILDRYEALG